MTKKSLIAVAFVFTLLGVSGLANAYPRWASGRSVGAVTGFHSELVFFRGGRGFRGGGRPRSFAWGGRRPHFNARAGHGVARRYWAQRLNRNRHAAPRYPWLQRRFTANQPGNSGSSGTSGYQPSRNPPGRTEGANYPTPPVPGGPGRQGNPGGFPVWGRFHGETPPSPVDLNTGSGAPIIIIGAGGSRPPIAPRYSRSSIQPPSAAVAALLTNKRFRPRELLIEVPNESADQLRLTLANDYGVQIRDLGVVELFNARIWHLTLAQGQDLRAILERLLQDNRVISAQPNYIYRPVQEGRQGVASSAYDNAPLNTRRNASSPPGAGVKVAIIDTCIDRNHTEIQGAVTAFYDATPASSTECQPENHGTAVASLIGGHIQIRGSAMGASLLSVRAFEMMRDENEVQGTSQSIFSSLSWAVTAGSQIANLSFAGPSDPLVERAVAAAYRKGVVLVGAAGNGGPSSEPLYPGAYPEVIAVTAIDGKHKLYGSANRGSYISVSARGVDVIVAHVNNQYGTESGTSFSAATVSGVVALMLERRPKAGPEEIRAALQNTAVNISGADTAKLFGHGVVNPKAATAFLESNVSQ
jgi:hypothetical protein